MRNFFITATDTDAGKTHIACALVAAFVQRQKKVAVFKPVAAGCENVNGQQVNEDVKLLAAQANCQQSFQDINPVCFLEPIAPHIAAMHNNQSIDVDMLIRAFTQTQKLSADINIIEGAGGWRLPLGNQQYLSDFVKRTELDVILVVNMKLGCLNHALLTYEAILADGLTCVAWLANSINDMPYLEDNIAELEKLLPMPLLAKIDHQTDIQQLANKIEVSRLLQ